MIAMVASTQAAFARNVAVGGGNGGGNGGNGGNGHNNHGGNGHHNSDITGPVDHLLILPDVSF